MPATLRRTLRRAASGTLSVLVLALGCHGQREAPAQEVRAVVPSTPTLPSPPPPEDSISKPKLDLEALAATRAACLRAPLSPSTSELPELDGHVHHTRGEHDELHVFLPPRPIKLSVSSYEATLKDMASRFPELQDVTLRSCEGERSRVPRLHCMQIEVQLCEAWLPQARLLLPILSSKGLGLVVAIQGRPGPRCSGDECQPLPYHDASNSREDLVRSGWFTLPYRPRAERSRVFAEFGRGTCESDGDCSITGCGNHCEAWHEAPHGSTCPAYRALDDAHCGCVRDNCAWFVQPPSYGVEAEVQVEGWVAPSKADVRNVESGERVFRDILEGGWLVRQLQYAAPRNAAQVPSHLDFQLALDSRFKVVKLNVSSEGAPAPHWVRQIFSSLPVPVPTFGREQSAPRRIIAHGHVVIGKR